ncbi:sigma-54-dependent transcriptional regulator EatR [soil metagenome]
MNISESGSHAAAIWRVVEQNPVDTSPTDEMKDDWLRQSWQRSVRKHRLDPGRSRGRRVLTAAELSETSERMGEFLDVAKPHIDDLDRHVSSANYCVLLTDAYGSTIDYRKGHDADNRFGNAGVRVGICWSEEEEGTCGIGTTIIDQKPTLVHKDEHFRADNTALSCSAAPVFNVDDELIAVLNASTLYSPYNRDSQALVFHFVNEKALQIENAYAERSLQRHWRLSVSPRIDNRSPETDWLLAFNESGELVGSNRPARQHLLGNLGRLPVSIEDLFGCSVETLFANAHAAPGLALPLRVAATGRLLYGVLRAPARPRPALQSTVFASGSATPDAAAPAAATGVVEARPHPAFDHLAIADRRLQDIVATACRLVNADIPLMLLGETGTGKEAFAKALHAHSERRDRAFVALNCAAIPETLIESELFGYRDGAFTGAKARGAKGKILQADGGTLFLDEIGDMPLLLQSRLLRVLAEGEVLALGADEPCHVNLHVVCATHQALDELMRAGRFREDLYYRLSGAVFQLPPLRDRDDIAEVIRRVLHEEGSAVGRPWIEIEREAFELLKAHPWPGNIRQLRHALRYACTVTDSQRLSLKCFPPDIALRAHPGPAMPLPASARIEPPSPPDAVLRERMLGVLKHHHWHVTPAAQELGVPRSTFYRHMKRLVIVPPNLTD